MHSTRAAGLLTIVLAALVAASTPLSSRSPATSQATAQAAGPAVVIDPRDARALYATHCASCHAGTDARIPTTASLQQRSPESLLDTLTTGAMRQQAAALTAAERRSVAEYLGGRALTAGTGDVSGGRCSAPSPLGAATGAEWTGWSPTLANTRFQSTAAAGLTAAQVPRLTLRWAFGLPNATGGRSLPTVFGGRVFVGNQDGSVFSLDAQTGCTYWTFKARSGVRTPVVIDPVTTAGRVQAYFGDGRGTMYAVNAATGDAIWSRSVDDHPSARLTGAPALYQGRLYVPVASVEEGQGNNPAYACCTFRGSVVALNATTGALIWKTYTIDKEPGPVGKNRGGSTRFGPSGAGVWVSPTIDPGRRLLYAATGNMYSEPQQPTSDAVMAFDLQTGSIVWTMQATARDVFVVGCNQPNAANCPEDRGRDRPRLRFRQFADAGASS